MDNKLYTEYIKILEEELVPAMGCTEPIAIAYAAALVRKTLGKIPEKLTLKISGNIIKNVKSVVVPNTGGLRGIAAAASAGIIAGDSEKELEVISEVSKEQIDEIVNYLETASFDITPSDTDFIFDIQITAESGSDSAFVQVAGSHTNVIKLSKNGEKIIDKEYVQGSAAEETDHTLLNVENIIEFANTVKIDDIKDVIGRQVEYNTAIAEEGLSGKWGANIGTVLLDAYGDDVHTRAKAWAAAGSDARMSGCERPVVINSGSGNQGMTASLPVIVYAKELGVSEERMFRALVVSNLITIHLKTGIGKLSAYCGATSAGCGAGAGISYLYGGGMHEIAHVIVNAVAINSGMICDGAKPSCAAKIASAVEAGLLGVQMQKRNEQFYGGDGIVIKGVENTIANIGRLASVGMRKTDEEIILMMTGN